jgi:hypothetical protein
MNRRSDRNIPQICFVFRHGALLSASNEVVNTHSKRQRATEKEGKHKRDKKET